MLNLKPISEYRLRSVFFRTLFALLALMIVMMAAFYFFSKGIISSSVLDISINTNKNLLSKTSDIVDSYLKFLEVTIQHLENDGNVISAAVAPNVHRADRNFALQNLLKTTSSDINLIQDIYIYITYNDTIYSSNRQILHSRDFPDVNISDVYSRHISAEPVDVENITTCLYNMNGTVYMARDFPLTGKKRMGIIVLKLDSTILYDLIQGDGNLKMPILIFDEEGKLIFSDAKKYPINYFPINVKKMQQSGQEHLKSSGSTFFIKTSDICGWTYVYEDKSDISALKVNNLLKTVFPVLLILLLLSISLSIYISYYIYRPIRNLMMSVLESSVSNLCIEKSKYHNELEYLSSSFHQALTMNDELSTTLNDIVPVMENQMILEVLAGRNSSSNAVEEYLGHLNSMLCGSGQFVIIAVLLNHCNGCPVNEIETKIYSINIKNIIQKVVSPDFNVRVVLVENGTWAVLLKYDQTYSQEAIKSCISALVYTLRKSIQENNFYVQVGVGRIKGSFVDIFHSYKEALRSIRFEKYLDASYKNNDISEIIDPTAFHLEYLRMQIEQITADAAVGDSENALEKVRQIIEWITGRSLSRSELTFRFKVLMDILCEVRVQYGIEDDDPSFAGFEADVDLYSSHDPEDITEYVEDVCNRHVFILCKYFSKRQNKVIYQAKKYIDENYANGLLSQNEVADYLGINASYFSTLFKRVLRTRFSEYLNLRRVENAKLHLDRTNLSIKQITIQDGFNSVQNFIRVFKRFVGSSPGQYREKNTQK
ncbi:AraC family transcriptional regulator [Marispirochaeta aestuarii]|uniref:AraC family transcriptional regulator n=1 Tax=Marispirochaeta aestuarii TaxID=1963862 RepID=UPI0029C73482|nr:AraC family transcriptional regulator [Marispirochaeta aestuarii]